MLGKQDLLQNSVLEIAHSLIPPNRDPSACGSVPALGGIPGGSSIGGVWWPGAPQSDLASINPTFRLNPATFGAAVWPGRGRVCHQAAGGGLNYLLS